MVQQPSLIVLAVGGNSLIADPAHRSVEDQYRAARATCARILPILRPGVRLVVTHGNGPQVGFILRRAELAASELHRVPLDAIDADTQGALGYMLQQALQNAAVDAGRSVKAATVVTRVRVDPRDRAFERPTKPVGSFMTEEEARRRAREEGWSVVEDAGRGWRRVVPSPRPLEIIDLPAIEALLERDFVVIAAGGGGIPVVRDEAGHLEGVEAVIDKDHASSLLARRLGADVFLISTGVPQVYLHYRTPAQRPVECMTVGEARRAIRDGHFASGSMLPKIEAMVDFVTATGGRAIVTDPENIPAALAGHGGTRIMPDWAPR